MTDLDRVEKEKLRGLISAINTFRAIDPEMQAQQMLVFLQIAMNEGIAQRDLAALCEVAISSTSRNVDALLVKTKRGKPGHGLVQSATDPLDARRLLQSLTAKGRDFLVRLLSRL